MRALLLFFFFTFLATSFAQVRQIPDRPLQRSEHGQYLSPHGTIRILLLFAEIEYDVSPDRDPQPNGAEHWPKGELPLWKDDVFDPHPLPIPQAMVSRYYHDISLGNYVVLGDYMDRMLTLRESEYPGVGYIHSINSLVVQEANKLGGLRTRHGLSVADFDLWKKGGRPGMPKEPGPDDPHSYDHLMVILRNSGFTHGQGSVDPGNPGALFGHLCDSQSRFGGMNALPFEILKHEFNHLLLGGNNFHSSGGSAVQFQSYFITPQGGWGMMGAASSSLLTCNGWDRLRLGWKAKDAPFPITARDGDGTPVHGDLDPLAGDTGIFVLRDFVTTGDALRIRLPHLREDEFPQWLWVENHLTYAYNGSPTDRFHYEDAMPCPRNAVPGMFAAVQVDREERQGTNIYGGDADYLRALPASGFNDYRPRGDTVIAQCLWPGPVMPLLASRRWSNPLSGASELEIPVFDLNGDGVIDRAKEGIVPSVEERDGAHLDGAMFLGHPRQVFTPEGNGLLSMYSDPALANMLTLVSTPKRDAHKRRPPNNRTVHLAGLSVRLLERLPDGALRLRVRNDDTFMDRDARWCADSIVLHAVKGCHGHSLHVGRGHVLRIDRSRTPTRLDQPERAGGIAWFSEPTSLTVQPGARMHLDAGATLELTRGSVLHLMPGSSLVWEPGARVTADGSSRIVVHAGAGLDGPRRQVRKLTRRGRIKHVP